MSVGKEYLYPLEHLARNAVRIYPDACDVGIFETEEVTKQIKWCLAGLAGFHGMKVEEYAFGRIVTVRLGFEMYEGFCQRRVGRGQPNN